MTAAKPQPSSSFSVASLANTLKPLKISGKKIQKYSWLPDVLRVRGTVLTRIIGPVFTVTVFATIIAILYDRGYNVTLANSVTPLLAVVVGLILVFRNTTSYGRYSEGCRDFGAMMSTIRNLARLIWINVNATSHDSALSPHALKEEKIKILSLLLAYAISVKHHLRGENGTDWEDYHGVLPKEFTAYRSLGYRETNANESYSTSPSSLTRSEGVRFMGDGHGVTPGEATPLLTDSHHTVDFHPYGDVLSLPLPIVIAHEITRMLYKFRTGGYLEVVGPAGTIMMMQLCASLSSQLTAMERIANTPIPPFYGVHLKQCVTLYLFALPSTLVADLGWRMILVVTVVAITLMGIEGIADELEMPFGKDECDLPLDQYCAELKNEIEYVISRLPSGEDLG